MKLKDGVDHQGVHTKVWEALWLIDVIYKEHRRELVVTSLREGKHSKKRSSHYDGRGTDIRTYYFNIVTLGIVFRKVQEKLGEDYVVVLEKTHIHIHWAPIYHDSSD